MTTQTLNSPLRDQLADHWTAQLRTRLDGVTDDECRDVIHHQAEVCLLRDLYLHTQAKEQ